MPNIVERPIVPYNPSPSRILQKEQYNLFAPIAANGRVGMAGFNSNDFDIKEQIVSLRHKLDNLFLKMTPDYKIELCYVTEGDSVVVDTIDAHIGLLLSKMIGNISVARNDLTNTYTLSINRDAELPGTGALKIASAQFSLPSNLATEEEVDDKIGALEAKSVIKDENGNVVITGNLDVQGEINEVNTNVMTADSPISIVNASALDGETPVDWKNGGVVIILSEEADENGFDAFGFVYNKTTELPLATLGKYKDGVFTANNPVKYITLSNGAGSKISAFPIVKEDGSIAPSNYNADSFVQRKRSPHILYGTDGAKNEVAIDMDIVSMSGSELTQRGSIPRRTSRGTLISTANAQTSNELVRYAQLKDVEYNIDKDIEDIDYRVEQLESASLKYTEFSGVTDAVQVPANSARYAIVEKIGGMTHKVVGDNLWDTKSMVTGRPGITVNEDGSITLNGTFDQIYIAIPSLDGDDYTCLSLGTNALDNNGIIMLSKYVEENDWWDETNASIENGVVSWDSSYDAELVLNGTFNKVKIYPMLVYGTKPKPYEQYSKILRSTDVTSIRSEEANGTLVDSISIPDTVKAKLPKHFEFGDGFEFGDDKVYYGNYLDTLTETVYGNVATMVLDGSEDSWTVKTASSGVTRLQISYTAGLGYPAASAPSTKDATPALCNAYESVSASFNSRGIEGIAFSASTFFVHDPEFTLEHFDSEADILDAWKAHLKNNPLTVVYKVATSVTKDVSNIIGDAFNRIAVKSLGKVKPTSDSGMAATMTVAFVEAKGVEQ